MNTPTYISKDFKTIDEQIKLLLNRDLIINNINSAEKHLINKNYFDLINGFETLLLVDSKAENKVYDNIYFEDFLFLYNFDKKLNTIILNIIDKIETRLKTSMAYRFCEQCHNSSNDNFCYLELNNYTNPFSNHLSLPQEIQYRLTEHDLFRIYRGGLNYVDYKKRKYAYLQAYTHPPFWVTIKTLTLGSTFKLLIAFPRNIFEKVINDMGLEYNEKQKFLNSIRILIDLRNSAAHFNLINRYRTSSNLRIDGGMIQDLNLKTKPNIHNNPTFYEIKLYDTLLVLSQYEDLSDIKRLIQIYYYKKCNSKRQRTIFKKLLERMGRCKLKDWEIF